jgi:hypothetical protein
MTPVDYYQQRAEECLRLAREGPDLGERDVMRELAARWAGLVERAEKKTGRPQRFT